MTSARVELKQKAPLFNTNLIPSSFLFFFFFFFFFLGGGGGDKGRGASITRSMILIETMFGLF